jgi:tripartite-type tricarboxylate transporter receptor subunit TctC
MSKPAVSTVSLGHVCRADAIQGATQHMALSKMLAFAGTLMLALTQAHAQTYPTKAIRMVCPFATGSTADALARTASQALVEAFGRQVVVDNRTGAGGTIGAEIVAKAPPDGYTLLTNGSNHSINATLYLSLPYDTTRDFAAVSVVGQAPQLLAIHASVPANSMREFIALAAAKPNELRYGSGGNGSPSHLAIELLKSMTGVKIVHVPYKGGEHTLIALLSGEVQLSSSSIRLVMPHVKAGRLKALSVTGAKRSPAIPDIPTVAEGGLPGYSMTAWWGVLAPAKTPKPIIAQLHQGIARGVQRAEVRDRLAAFGVESVGNSPAEFDALIRREIVQWAKVIKESGARVD